MISEARLKDVLQLEIEAKVALIELRNDLPVNTEFPVRVGPYRIHRDKKKGIRIDELDNPNLVKNGVRSRLRSIYMEQIADCIAEMKNRYSRNPEAA